jgi:beta-lactamase class A
VTDLTLLFEGFSGDVSVAFGHLDRVESYTRRATEPLLSASLIKLPLLLAALSGVSQGKLDLNERMVLQAGDRVGGSGILKTVQPGLNPTLRDLLTLMIVVSDNTATNMVIERVGQETVNTFCRQHGLSGTELVGKLQLPESKQNEAQRRGARNHTCAADMLGLLLGLARGDLLPPLETELALSILKQQGHSEALARYLPTDPELDAPYVEIASKSGCLHGLWHDAGIVFRDGIPLYALVVMTHGSADRRFHPDQEGVLLIAEVSRRIYEYVTTTGRIG